MGTLVVRFPVVLPPPARVLGIPLDAGSWAVRYPMADPMMPGPPLSRFLASVAIGVVLSAAGWWFMDNLPAAMLAEADAAAKSVVVGTK